MKEIARWGGGVFLALDQPKPKGRVSTWDGEKTRNQVLRGMLKALDFHCKQNSKG